MNTKIDPAGKDSTITWMDLQPGKKVRERERRGKKRNEEEEEML